jgi:hypothetical protein
MSVVVMLNNQIAYVDNYQWHSADKETQDALTQTLNPLGPSPADGDYDYSAALRAQKILGAKIIDADIDDEKDPEEIVY